MSAQASTLYVNIAQFSPTCNDKGPGTLAEPFCTIQAAADAASPGQTVEILSTSAETAAQSVTITHSGTPAQPITFTYAPGYLLAVSPWAQTGHAVITIKDVHDVILDGLQVVSNGTDDGVDVIGSSDITIAGMQFQTKPLYAGQQATAQAEISVDGTSSNVTISRNLLWGTARNAVLAAPGASAVTVTTNDVPNPGGSAIALAGVANAVVTSNTALGECPATGGAGNAVALSGGSSATVENNVLQAEAGTGCPAIPAALSVDASSAAGTKASYNALYGLNSGPLYSWAGTSYDTAGNFQAAVAGQGTNDIALPHPVTRTPPEGSPVIDSADCTAPGELGTDIYGKPRVQDPLATDANLANGTCHADRGAYEAQDTMPFSLTQAPVISSGTQAGRSVGVVPFTASVTVAPALTPSRWGEPVTYTVDFGDGSTPVTATPGTATPHVYTTAGKYTVTVTATDTSGSTSTQTGTAYALPATPLAPALSAVPQADGQLIIQDSATITDLRGGNTWQVATASIAYGDGAASTAAPVGPDETGYTWNHLYGSAGTYTATVTQTDLLGRTSTATVTITVGDVISDITPVVAYNGTVPAHGVVKVPYSRFGGYGQALVDLTVTSPKDAGYVVAYPDGMRRTNLAAIQFQAGRSAENSALVTRSATDFYNGSAAPVHLTVTSYATTDKLGPTGGPGGDTYTPVTPVRVLSGAKVPGGHSTVFKVAGIDGIPTWATDVVVDITAVNTQATGDFVTRPEDGPDPSAWSLTSGYWAKGQQVTNEVMIPVNGRAVLRNESKGTTAFTADVVGYYMDARLPGSVWLPATPARLATVTLAGRHFVKLQVAGRNRIPATGTTAVQVNLTATRAAANGTITGYADGTPRPGAVNLSYATGATLATEATVATGTDGAIDLYNAGPRPVTLTIDLTGSYYRYPPGS
jgi:hypothetical protein